MTGETIEGLAEAQEAAARAAERSPKDATLREPESFRDYIARLRTQYGVEYGVDADAPLPESAEKTLRANFEQRRAQQEKWELEQVPGAFRWATFDSPALAKVVSAKALSLAKESVLLPRVVLVGPAGAGKTTLACAMFRARMRGTRSVGYFGLAWRLGLARAKHELGKGEPESVEKALRADLCVLDDVGSERQTQTNAVPDVIFERHAEGRALWVTTAMGQEEMAQRYGDGIARRVFEHARIIDCGAGS